MQENFSLRFQYLDNPISRKKKIYTLLLRIMFLILFSLNRIRSDSFARPLQFLQTSLCWKRHFTLVSFIFGRVFHSMHPRGGERRRTWKEEFGQLLTLVHTPVVVNIRLHGVWQLVDCGQGDANFPNFERDLIDKAWCTLEGGHR